MTLAAEWAKLAATVYKDLPAPMQKVVEDAFYQGALSMLVLVEQASHQRKARQAMQVLANEAMSYVKEQLNEG